MVAAIGKEARLIPKVKVLSSSSLAHAPNTVQLVHFDKVQPGDISLSLTAGAVLGAGTYSSSRSWRFR